MRNKLIILIAVLLSSGCGDSIVVSIKEQKMVPIRVTYQTDWGYNKTPVISVGGDTDPFWDWWLQCSDSMAVMSGWDTIAMVDMGDTIDVLVPDSVVIFEHQFRDARVGNGIIRPDSGALYSF